MKREHAEEFTQGLGQIGGGMYRTILAAIDMGVPQALGLEPKDWVNGRLGGYVQLAKAERRKVAVELNGEGRSTREIADAIGVSHVTVFNDLNDVKNLTEHAGNGGESVNNLTAHVSHNSGENEWYTPPALVAAARAVMGRIDLDPASSALANKTVGASHFYTAADDGLTHDWAGRVWMNPPYAQPAVNDFCEMVTAKYQGGKIEQACVLVNNATETAWFQRMLEAACAVCLVKSRVRFLDPQGNPGAPLQGQAVLYFGPQTAEFVEHFGAFGKVLRA